MGSGRKGTVDEEEYLLKSITKLVARFNSTQGIYVCSYTQHDSYVVFSTADAANLLPHLLQFTEEHKREARALQSELESFEEEVRVAVEEIWTKPVSNGDATTEVTPDGWAARMLEHERQRQVDPLDKVTKPELAKQEWRLRLPTG